MRGRSRTRRTCGPLEAFVLLGVVIAPALNAGGAAAAPVPVAIELPAALAGKAAKLSFLLLDGDGAINNTVTVTGFLTNGTIGAASPTGGVSGDLGGTLTLADQDFFNEWLQGNRSGGLSSRGPLNRRGAKVAKELPSAPLARVARGAAPPGSRHASDGRFRGREVRGTGEAAAPAGPVGAAHREALASLAPWRWRGSLRRTLSWARLRVRKA